MDKSIEYYNQKADAFFDRTINIDMSLAYGKFLSHLSKNAKILDAGCGVGRDAKYFKDLGYDITAFDGSIEMTRLSSNLLGQPTLHLKFQDIAFVQEFDAIWACASLLHVPYDELGTVIKRLYQAVKPQGVFYASFKYGDCQRTVEERTFYDMNEKIIQPYLGNLFSIIEFWQTPDMVSKIAPSPANAWLNVLCRKRFQT